MKLKLIKDLLSDVSKMLRPLIFDIALAIPIIAFNVCGLEEVTNDLRALKHTLKALGSGVLTDIIWVAIWVFAKSNMQLEQK